MKTHQNCLSSVKRSQAVTDIIESVALEEAALANILCAEGEKLQRIICMKEVCPKVLLQANDSVQSMVDTITRLEIVLQSKLTLFDDCLCKDKYFATYDEDCDCDDKK